MLHVHPSTIRRWIARGDLPAYRSGHRRVVLKRPDLERMIAPTHEQAWSIRDQLERDYRRAPIKRRLTPEEQRRGLEALERIARSRAEIMAERGAEPLTPASWELLNEARDERRWQLDDLC